MRLHLFPIRQLKHSESNRHGKRVQSKWDISSDCDRDTAINDEAVRPPEGLEGGGGGSYDCITAVAVVLKHTHVHLLLRIGMQRYKKKEVRSTFKRQTRLPV